MIVSLHEYQSELEAFSQDGSNGEPRVAHLPNGHDLYLVIPMRRPDLLKEPVPIASECRSANIVRDHAMILPDDATPKPDGIFGRDSRRMRRDRSASSTDYRPSGVRTPNQLSRTW